MTVIKLNEKEKIIEDGAKIGLKVLKTIKTIKIINQICCLILLTIYLTQSNKYKTIYNEEDAYDVIFIFTEVTEGIGD